MWSKTFSQESGFPFSNQSLVSINPSFAGSNGGIRNQSTWYYTQFPHTSSGRLTINNTFDSYIKPLRGSLAVSYGHDDLLKGLIKTNFFSTAYAQHFSLYNNRLKLTPSLKFSYIDKSLDYIRIYGAKQLVSHRKTSYLGTGLLLNYKALHLGVSVLGINLNRSGVITSKQSSPDYNLYLSYNKKVSEKTLFQVSMIAYSESLSSYTQLNFNALFFKHLMCGVTYLSYHDFNSGNLMFNTGYRSNFYAATLGYNNLYGVLSPYVLGSWTATFSFNLRNKELRKELTNFENW